MKNTIKKEKASCGKSLPANFETQELILKAEDICYTYDDGTKALNGINLEIRRGRKIALMGANGSGKSTFFLCLNGIYRPQSGTIYFNGAPIDYSRKGLLRLRAKVGIVFQDPDNQLFSASVYQEISFGVMNLGIPAEEARVQVEKVISDLDIEAFRNKPTHFLSGGQKKQVSIADIVVMNPDIIILDEPSAALDPKHTSMVNRMIDRLTDRGITVIMSSHDVNHALGWADEVILFHEGRILMSGTPEQVFVNKSVLHASHLEQPLIVHLFESLCKKGILHPGLPIPRTLKTLEAYIEQVHTSSHYGGKQNMTNETKKAILAVSFGTSYHETREKTIDRIEEDFQTVYPDYKLYRAWTSKMIIKKLEKRDGIKVSNVTEAMEQLLKDGITDLIVQPTHIINGIENDLMRQDVLEFKDRMNSIGFGDPLLTTTEDNIQVIHALMEAFRDLKDDEALVFMGHGTTHYANSVYAALDYTFKDMGFQNVFLGTVEAYPSMDSLLKLVRDFKPRKVHLAPFMVVAGDHANNDMSGEEEDSWKKRLEKAGFEVVCHMTGLGEYEGIRRIYLEHIRECMEIQGI